MNEHIEQWQTRARREAERHDHHACKRAVQETTPTDEQARSLHKLFAEHREDIRHWCKTALDKIEGQDRPSVDIEDLMAEAYILMQRSLVRYDPEKAGLRTFLQHDLRGRIRDYLRSVSHESVAGTERPEREDREPIAPGFDIPQIYRELVQEGRVSPAAARLWRQAHPDGE